MFTVKFMGQNGTQTVHSCNNYYITPPGIDVPAGDPPEYKNLYLFDEDVKDPLAVIGNKVLFEIRPGTVAYIENENGHTVDVVRPQNSSL